MKKTISLILSIVLIFTLVSCRELNIETRTIDVLASSNSSHISQMELQMNEDGSAVVTLPQDLIENFEQSEEQRYAMQLEQAREEPGSIDEDSILEPRTIDRSNANEDGSVLIELTEEELFSYQEHYKVLSISLLDYLVSDEFVAENPRSPYISYEVNEDLDEFSFTVDQERWELDENASSYINVLMPAFYGIYYQFYNGVEAEDFDYRINFYNEEVPEKPFYRIVRK